MINLKFCSGSPRTLITKKAYMSFKQFCSSSITQICSHYLGKFGRKEYLWNNMISWDLLLTRKPLHNWSFLSFHHQFTSLAYSRKPPFNILLVLSNNHLHFSTRKKTARKEGIIVKKKKHKKCSKVEKYKIEKAKKKEG